MICWTHRRDDEILRQDRRRLDNFVLSVGCELCAESDGKKLYNTEHLAFAQIGAHYFVPIEGIGITLNVFDLSLECRTDDSFEYDSIQYVEVKSTSTNFLANFDYGASVGVKYYF